MASNYSTIQQHEPLRVPNGWTGEDRRLIAQLEEIFDDIYRRFGRLGLSDLSEGVRNIIKSAEGLRIEVFDAIENIDEFHGTTVEITNAGVGIKTGGIFAVDSEKFDIDENGVMSATDARISGQLSVDGNEVWHKGNIIVSTVEPVNPPVGALWVLPDMTSIPAAGTWTMEALPARPWENPYDAKLSGANIGAAPSNAEYTYTVSVPVYHKWEDEKEVTCTVYLGASKGATTISMGSQIFTKSGTYKKSIKTTQWLGNSNTIYMRVSFSGSSCSVNSHSPLSCTLTAKANSATGWRSCNVQMYTG